MGNNAISHVFNAKCISISGGEDEGEEEEEEEESRTR
jgi:hypothetical protein